MTVETAPATAPSGVRKVDGAPLLELEGVKMHFKTKGEGFFSRATQWVQASPAAASPPPPG
jgi:hypothetical protein